jgi:hypothetical protein
MSQAGLSYEQAPPLGLPLRFFLTAPLFLLLAAIAALPTAEAWTASRWTPAALALTHLITLGFLGQVMMGALLQMLPVVIGSPVPWPRLTASLGHLGLTAGTLLLAAGLGGVQPSLLLAGMALLAAGWLPFLAATAASLARARTASKATLHPMRKAWFALSITLALGTWLGGTLAGLWPSGPVIALAELHAAWGLLGWVSILVMGVAYQVVPMLQITPAYPAPAVAWLTWTVFGGLILFSLSRLMTADLTPVQQAMIWLPLMAAMALFALVTLDLQRRRRRKRADATLGFWRLGMISLLALASLPFLAGSLPEHAHEPLETTAGLLFLLGFAASVVNGMLYKIVPFLAWFHLQTQTGARAGTIPNMKEFVPEAEARKHLHLHLAAVILLQPAPWLPPAWSSPGLLALAASAHLLWRNLLGCARLFRRYGGRLG